MEIVLASLIVLALLKASSFPLALTLCLVWLVDALMAGEGNYLAIPWVDVVAVYPIVMLARKNLKWWSVACVVLSLFVLPVHLWYWTLWSIGQWHPETYKFAANTLFLASVAVLVVGNYDIAALVGRVLERLRSLSPFPPRLAVARAGNLPRLCEETLSDRAGSLALRGIQSRKHRMGDRKVNFSRGAGEGRNQFCNRSPDVSANSGVHVSTQEA